MPQRNFSIPIAIVIAGIFIAGAVYVGTPSDGNQNNNPETTTGSLEKVPKVSVSDHMLGSPTALVTIVEYADLDCPFCRQFHITMKAIMDVYGKNGNVKWVYRHFPIAELHPNAPKLAEASECIAEELGNDGFWKFVEVVYAAAPGNAHFDMNTLTTTAISIGAKGSAFDSCLASGKYKKKVANQFDDAVAAGGTIDALPYSIIITKDNERAALRGAQSYATVKSVIEAALSGTPQ